MRDTVRLTVGRGKIDALMLIRGPLFIFKFHPCTPPDSMKKEFMRAETAMHLEISKLRSHSRPGERGATRGGSLKVRRIPRKVAVNCGKYHGRCDAVGGRIGSF